MKKIILLIAVVFSTGVISASAQSRVRVSFAKNQYEKTVSGSVKGSDYVDYVIRINEYEFIESTLTSANKNVKFTVRKTDGSEYAEGIDVRKFSGEAEKTGDYVFRVYVKGGGSGVTKFRLKVSAFMGT
jgi:hypothetical protein